MSGKVVGMVFDHYPDGATLLLAVKLADNADQSGRRIFPSVSTLARQTRQHERTVQRQLRYMQEIGWLQLVRHGHGGRGLSREYRIDPQFIAAYDTLLEPAERPTWTPKSYGLGTQADAKALAAEDKKGGILPPFLESKRVTSDAQKGDIAVSQKGDIAMSPQHHEHHEHHRTNTPLPPVGGESVFEKIAKAFPRQDVADMTAAKRELAALQRKGFDSAQHLEPMLAAMHRERASRQWQQDGGRFVPSLSKWLRGYGNGGFALMALPLQGDARASAWDASRQSVEAAARSRGMGNFEAEQLAHYQRQGRPLPWAEYVGMVRKAMGGHEVAA